MSLVAEILDSSERVALARGLPLLSSGRVAAGKVGPRPPASQNERAIDDYIT
jgi:hypothetical protein